jgi:hypothetical protein
MRTRLTLAAVAALAAASLGTPAQATVYCAPEITPHACTAVRIVCQSSDVTYTLCTVTR